MVVLFILLATAYFCLLPYVVQLIQAADEKRMAILLLGIVSIAVGMTLVAWASAMGTIGALISVSASVGAIGFIKYQLLKDTDDMDD